MTGRGHPVGPDPTPEELRAWDDAHLWHPFTPHSVYRAEEPLQVVAGDGHYLVDTEGRRYLDGVGSLWCNLFGHRHPVIDAAVQFLRDAGAVPRTTIAAESRAVRACPRALAGS